MPTAFSHALVAGALAWLAPRRQRGLRLALLLALLAVLPDLDVLGLYVGVPYDHTLGHRGFTHSLAFAALAGACAAGLWPRGESATPGTRWSVAALGFLAAASHGFLDAFTDAGLGVGFWVPLSDVRSFSAWRPLATAPLSPGAILSARLLPVLASELLWIAAPLACVASCVWLARRRVSKTGSSRKSPSRGGPS